MITFYPQVFWIVWKSSRKAVRGDYDSSDWARSSFDILRALENVGVRFEITGMDNMRRSEGPVVFISNHMSTLETFVLPCIIQPIKETTFIVKQGLVSMPVFGPVMRSRDPVVVGRVNPREDLRTVLEEGAKKLAAGRSIVVFPQSTRSPAFNPAEFNTLGIKLALKAGVPVVPVALRTDAWGAGKIIKDFGRVDKNKRVCFAFGKPMEIKGRGAEEHQKVIAFIQDNLAKWKREDENREQVTGPA
ncbi:MAG: 1-acyl-sn-glycerol-3-phosphate acyltransferase [Nitrospira bacterium HGW-Nitrospira-1]|nr:MAG: 1-acyl-sn-glycerol-3-phosphate acyltransferase [Nitrospira bacterium HGW-Nitrospira-1]